MFSAVALAATAIVSVGAESPSVAVMLPGILNIKDFGAKGDGATDDTGAIEKALAATAFEARPRHDPKNPAAAVPPARPSTIFFPEGRYRVTKTIVIEAGIHNGIVLQGAGGPAGMYTGRTEIVYDGPAGGHLLDCWSFGLRLRDLWLVGGGKAGVLLRVNSRPGSGTAIYAVERVHLQDAECGVECGAEPPEVCASDMTFTDLEGLHLGTGFRTMNAQNLNYALIRPVFEECGIGYHFKNGGSVVAVLPSGGRCETFIKIEGGGINAGTFQFIGMRMEPHTGKKASVWLEASGETQVQFSGLLVTCMGVWKDADGQAEATGQTPKFILGPSAQVTVQNSIIAGRIARLTGPSPDQARPDAGATATWIQFDNCRFRCGSDPATGIECDDYSGYEFRNCHVVQDDTQGQEYQIRKSVMIPHLVKYPRQAEGQPGIEPPRPAQP